MWYLPCSQNLTSPSCTPQVYNINKRKLSLIELGEHFKMALPSKQFDQLKERINSNTAPDGQCLLWMGKAHTANGKYGKIKVIIRDGGGNLVLKQAMTVHRAMYIANQKSIIEEGPHYDVSHLCHNTKCVHIPHLVLELHDVNMHRIECHHQGKCSKQHTPFCIFV